MNILKRLVASVIALRDRFSDDIYLATRIKIAICVVSFISIIIGTFLMMVSYVKNVFALGVIKALLAALNTGKVDPTLLLESSQRADTALYFIIFTIVILAVLFGIIVSRLTLAPIKQAFQMQRRFISGIAHELRTPLSILRMNNEIARMENSRSANILALLDENISDIDMISEILNNLLLFDRILSAGSLKLEHASLKNIANHAARRLSSLAERKNIDISISGANIPLLHGSKTGLEQVFFNIIKNAVSYTQDGGSVKVFFEKPTTTEVQVRITDTGVGIPEKDLSHIFEPFYRSEKTGKLSGMGIGLAIVYEIMKLHNGTIEVKSVEGKGTSFLLSFPIQEAHTMPTVTRFPTSLFSSRILKKEKSKH